MSGAVEVEGLRQLTRDLRRIDAQLVERLKASAKAAAELVATTAQLTVPRRSGTLAGTIRASGTTKGGKVMAGYRRRAPYAPLIHFGAVRDSSRARQPRRLRNIRPHPFLYEALDRRRTDVVDAFARQVQKVLDEAGGPS